VAEGIVMRTRLVYLLAASHSGSTLLAMLLGRHPDVCTVGELKATSLGDVERYRCSCGALIRQCGFWQSVSSDMASSGFAFDIADARTDIRHSESAYVRQLLKPLHRGPVSEALRDLALSASPTWRRHREENAKRNAALASTLLARTGKRIVVDSSKIGIRLKHLLRNDALDVQVIRIVRDGRGVSLTYMRPAEFADARDRRLREGGMGGDRAHQSLSMKAAAKQWRRSNEEAEAILSRLDRSQWIQVHYEQLCAEPIATLRTLSEFLKIDPTKLTLDFRAGPHHILGNGMRLDSVDRIDLDERWRSELTAADHEVFQEIAGPCNRALGYV
jgi:hypothetical protein